MFAWNSYEKFATTTELHGFDQVPKYGKLWAAVWLCLTVAACGMCMNDVINLAITYESEPTVISLSLTPNLDMRLPNPTLCMEVIVDSLWEPFDTFLSDSGLVNTLFTYGSYPTSYIELDLQSFLSATQNANDLNISYRDQLNLTLELRYFTYLMLSYTTEAELSHIGLNNTDLTSYVVSLAPPWTLNSSAVNATIAYLYHSYVEANVSFANLKRLVGMDICQERTELLTRLNNTHNETSPICSPLSITHLSFSMVCSKLFDNDAEELIHYSSVTLSGTRVSLKDGKSSSQLFKYNYDSPAVTFAWHLDMQGRLMLPVGSRQDIFTWNPYYGRAFDLTVAAEYNFYNTKRDPCQTVEKQYDCQLNDKIGQMQSKCGCRPSSLLSGDTDKSLPTCSENPSKPVWILTNDSSDNPLYGNFTEICGLQAVTQNSCVRDCRLVTYLIEYSQPSKRLLRGTVASSEATVLPSGVLQFTVNMGKSRQLIEESPAKSFNTFICEFGGSIGAWLGASLLAFIHAAIYIVYACCDMGKRMKGKN